MRTARIRADSSSYYHCMSRVIEGRFIFGEDVFTEYRDQFGDMIEGSDHSKYLHMKGINVSSGVSG